MGRVSNDNQEDVFQNNALFDILCLLKECPDLTGAEIALGLDKSRQGIYLMLERLEKLGFIELKNKKARLLSNDKIKQEVEKKKEYYQTIVNRFEEKIKSINEVFPEFDDLKQMMLKRQAKVLERQYKDRMITNNKFRTIKKRG